MLLLNFFLSGAFAASAIPLLVYEVDLKDLTDDLIKVTLHVEGLTKENAIYQFAATAPGTYQVMDIGRYVRSFRAFDKTGCELSTVRRSINQWELSEPEKVCKIKYTVAETWDTPVADHQIFTMCGTSLEEDHVFLNGQAVFGFPSGLQSIPILLKLSHCSSWKIGTALEKNAEGYYLARNYGDLVDSPILAGNLSNASVTVAGARIDVYTYSKTGLIQAELLLKNMEIMLQAAGRFIGNLPVRRYTFLFYFGDQTGGGWEHNYSSGYVIKEEPLTKAFADRITYLATHEFLHIITPLHIHSNAIDPFNFVIPSPSEHLWLYEGVTEWASHIMPLRGQMINLDTYLDRLSDKIAVDKSLDTSMSLSSISLNCYLPDGQQQSWNFYNRGALVAGLLDIRLLELSGGRRGLQEVINELIKKYGPENPFPEKEFFSLFVDMTYPEIADFINRYIKNTEPLPLADYFARIGISYIPALATGKKSPFMGVEFEIVSGKLYVSNPTAALQDVGLKAKDMVHKINGVEVDVSTPQGLAYFGILKDKLKTMAAGQIYYLTVLKNNRKETIACRVLEQDEIKKYVFRINPDATDKQRDLYDIWQRNRSSIDKPTEM